MRELASIENPKGMAYGIEENIAGTLKRRYPGNGDEEIAPEYASSDLGGGGRRRGEDEDDVREERLSKAKEEVVQLANNVAEYRQKGPVHDVGLTQLLEKLSKVQEEIIDLAGKDVVETLKRPFSVNGDKEISVEDLSCSRGGREEQGGGGEEEDDSEESLTKVQKEVIEMAEKVAEYREKGPVAFAQLLDKSLAEMRTSLPSMETPANNNPTCAAENEDGVAASTEEVQANLASSSETLIERLTATSETSQKILRDIKLCKERLEKAITSRRQTQAKHPSLVQVLKMKL